MLLKVDFQNNEIFSTFIFSLVVNIFTTVYETECYRYIIGILRFAKLFEISTSLLKLCLYY